MPRFRDKLAVWFMPPEWRPAGFPKAELDVLPDRPKFYVRLSRVVGAYFVVAFLVSTAVALLFLFRGARATASTKIIFAAWFVATVGGLGAVVEGRSWAKWFEIVRTAATPSVIYLLAA
jgi:hypothetical protein